MRDLHGCDQALYCSGFGVRDMSAAAASGTLVVPS
jgi:hypothetical protein